MRRSRIGLHVVMAALLSVAMATPGQQAYAQEYPSREIKLLCGFAAGSGADITYRFLAEKIRPLVGKPVIVENRPGVQGYLAASELAKSRPDGHTIMLAGGSGLAAVPYIFKNPPVDPMHDFEYVGSLLKQGWYLSVDAKSPIKSIPELTAFLTKELRRRMRRRQISGRCSRNFTRKQPACSRYRSTIKPSGIRSTIWLQVMSTWR